MSDNKTSKERAEDLLFSLRSGKKTHDEFSHSFRTQYLIAGKTIEDWEVEFKIEIPVDLNTITCRDIDGKLMQLHQEASFHKATADAIMKALKKGSETEFRSR